MKAKNKKTIKYWMRKATHFLPIFLLAIMLCTTGIMAYLRWSDLQVKNDFSAASVVAPMVNEDTTIGVGDIGYSVYVRTEVVAVWTNGTDVLAVKPVLGTDYNVSYNTAAGWLDGSDGYYYYKSPVASGNVTPALISTNEVLTSAPTTLSGFDLKLVIAAQTIQAAGKTDDDTKYAVEAEWGVIRAVDGTIKK